MKRFRIIGLMIMLLLAGRLAAQVPVLDSVCSGTVRHYRVVGEAGSTYTWILTLPAGSRDTLSSDADTVKVFWNYQAGVYILQCVQHAENRCDADAVYGQVFIFGQPYVDAGPDARICTDMFYKLNYSSADSTGSLLWMTDGDGTFSDPAILHPAYFPGSNDILTGTVNLRLTGQPIVQGGGCEPSIDYMVLSIVDQMVPQFDPIGPFCQFFVPPALPDTSLDGIAGTWDPAVINTDFLGTFPYTFSPTDTAGCAIDTTILIQITDEIVPVFDQIGPLCINQVPPALPEISLNNITGIWDPDTISTDVPGIFTYRFTPDDPSQCGVDTTMNIAIVPPQAPIFDPIGPYCQNTTPPPLPGTSNNGISGSWNPLVIDTSVPGTSGYTFTPYPDECGTDTTIMITIIESVDPMFDQIGPLCQYQAAPALPDSSLNGISGIWSPAWINTTFPGTFTFTFTPNDPTQCGTVYYMYITIIEEVTPQFDPIGTLCQFSPAPALPDTSLEGITGTWVPPVITTDDLGTFFYTFHPDTTYQCTLDTTLVVEVISDRTPHFDTIGPLCQFGVPPALPDTSLEGISGTWVPDTINTSITGTSIYTFTPEDGQCAVEEVEIGIEITTEIIPEFDPFEAVCQYTVAPALPDTSANDITGTWTPPVINTDVTGTFSFVFKPDSLYLCAQDTTIQITIVSEIVPVFDTILPLCQNSDPPDLPEVSNNGVQGSWDPPNIDTSVPGVYTYMFNPDGAAGNCAIAVHKDITIVTEIIPEFDTILPVCQNDVPPVLPSTSNNNITGIWNPSIIDTSVPGVYDYTFTPDNPAQCGVEVIVPVTIVTGFTPEFESISSLCQNSQAPVLPSTSINNITGTWNPPAINTNIPGTVLYTFTPDEDQCALVYTMNVTVNALPVVFAGADQTIPNASSTTIGDATASGNGPLTYSWTPASLLADATVLNPSTFRLTATTTFTLTVTDSSGCVTSDEVTITVAGEPLEAITDPGKYCNEGTIFVPIMVDKFENVSSFRLQLNYNADNLTCEGQTNNNPLIVDINSTVDQIAGIIVINWQETSPVTLTGLEKVCDLIFTPKQPGQGQLDWYIGPTESYFTDAAGLPIPATFFAGDILIADPPEIMLAPSKTVCVGDSLTIVAVASGMYPPLTYVWTYPDGHDQIADPCFPHITEADAGDYILYVTDSLGCTDQQSIQIIVSPNPVAAFHGSDTLVVPPGYILEAGSGYAFYQWNTGEMTESIRVDTTGWYWVDMTTFVDCMGTDSVYVKVSEEILYDCLWIPNAFTPDGDGLNETFKPVTRCELSFYRMFIYNRWGEKLFESADISIGWDGTYKGRMCPADVYVYKIAYKATGAPETDMEQVKAGPVTIVRGK